MTFTLAYLVFAVCFVFPPDEVRSAGLTVQSLLAAWLGSEDAAFVQYHLRRSTGTLLAHSLLPLGEPRRRPKGWRARGDAGGRGTGQRRGNGRTTDGGVCFPHLPCPLRPWPGATRRVLACVRLAVEESGYALHLGNGVVWYRSSFFALCSLSFVTQLHWSVHEVGKE